MRNARPSSSFTKSPLRIGGAGRARSISSEIKAVRGKLLHPAREHAPYKMERDNLVLRGKPELVDTIMKLKERHNALLRVRWALLLQNYALLREVDYYRRRCAWLMHKRGYSVRFQSTKVRGEKHD